MNGKVYPAVQISLPVQKSARELLQFLDVFLSGAEQVVQSREQMVVEQNKVLFFQFGDPGDCPRSFTVPGIEIGADSPVKADHFTDLFRVLNILFLIRLHIGSSFLFVIRQLPAYLPQCLHERVDVDGLGQMAVHSMIVGSGDIFREGVGCHSEDRYRCGVFPAAGTYCICRLVSVHYRHLDIHEDQTVFSRRGRQVCIHRFLSVFRGIDLRVGH